MNWLYLPDSKTYLNMNNVVSVRPAEDGFYLVQTVKDVLWLKEQDDIEKIREYLDRIAYC